MSWTAPHTATTNETLTSSIWNASVRDNLLASEGVVPNSLGSHIVVLAANSIGLRSIRSAVVGATETTTSTSYTDLATSGPSASVTTGTSAIVMISAEVSNSSTNSNARFSFAISSATTVAASDDWSGLIDGLNAFAATRKSVAHRVTGLTPGTNVFTMKYLAGSGIGSFGKREIIVIPF